MQRQRAAGLPGPGTGDGEDFGTARSTQFVGKPGLRFNQHARPARLFQVPGLRAQLRLVSTDLDEVTLAAAEERSDQPHFLIG